MQLRPYRSLKSLVKMALAPKRALGSLRYSWHNWSQPHIAHFPEATYEAIAPRDHGFKDLSFTFAVIALSARIACADGALTREKYVAFREAFPLRGGLCGKIRKLFSLACKNGVPAEHYVTHIKYTYPRQLALFESLIERLFRIAAADGSVSPAEERMLAKAAHMLGISAARYSELRERHINPKPHQVLGLEKRPRTQILKKRYHELMRLYHPDRFAAEPVSPEIDLLLQLRTSEINHAYRRLSRKAA